MFQKVSDVMGTQMKYNYRCLKADLDGTTFAYDCCMQISRACAARVMQKIAHNSRHSRLHKPTTVVGFLNMF